jgi:hypothetical protein
VDTASSFDRVQVTARLEVFRMVRVLRNLPSADSPAESLPGVTTVSVRIARSTWIRPAPCRWAASRMPRSGSSRRLAGDAVFCSRVNTSSGFIRGAACSISATAPATCGAAMDVPEFTTYPLPCSSGCSE